MKLSIFVLCLLSGFSLTAEPPRIDAEFALKSGSYTVEISGKHKFCIYRIKYKDFVIGENTGFYGSILATDKCKFIGAGHSEGGEEKVEFLTVLADGSPAELSKDVVVSADKIEFRKISMQDNLRVYTAMTVTPDSVRIDRQFEAIDAQKIYSFYIFQYCWTPESSEWIAGRPDGNILSGEFRSDDSWHLRNEQELLWYSLYAPDAKTGILGYFAGYFPGQGSYMLWDKKIYHKFYFSAALPKIVEKGYKSPQYSMLLKGFNAEPDNWKAEAGKLAASFLKEFPLPSSNAAMSWDFEVGWPDASENDPFGGKRCLEFKGNGAFACKKIPLKVEAGQQYRISFVIRKGVDTSSKQSSNYLLVGQYDENKKFQTFGTYADSIPRDGKWHEVVGKFQSPETLLDCNIFIYNKNSNDSIWIDNINIEKVNQD